MDDLLLLFCFLLFSPLFFFFALCRFSCLSFSASALSFWIPPPCHPQREEEARALFDRAAGSCREHQEPSNGNGSCPLDRDKGMISAARQAGLSLFCFSLQPWYRVVPRLIEIPDRKESYGARSEEKQQANGWTRRDGVITGSEFLMTSRWLFSLARRGEAYVGYGENQSCR